MARKCCAMSRSVSSAAKSRQGHNSVEELWRQFFSDPLQWWDHTSHKGHPKYPDFKHKQTGVGLWIESIFNPSWVKSQLASMPPGSVSRSLYSWNTMISECVASNDWIDALKLYSQMQAEGAKPDAFTFSRVINACANLLALEEGKRIHAQAIESGCDVDVFVGSTLVDMYAKCGSVEDAERVFERILTRDVVCWTAMLGGYVKCEEAQKALEQFTRMQEEGVKPNPVTFVVALNACASVMALEEGRRAHAQVIESGFQSEVFLGSTLVDMYSKCGSMEDAERVFHKMSTRNVVSWTAMLAGYVKCNQEQKALKLFSLMQEEGMKPNSVTFVVVLNACASLMALEEGRRVHAQVIQSGFEYDMFVGNTLVDMYAKCGSIGDAQRVFLKMPTRDVISWTAMLGGFAMHGHGKEALELFREMHQAGVQVERVTFICLLSACSHGGLVEEGVQLFESMGPVYGISQSVEHYRCMVDLLGRAGRLDEAEALLRSVPKFSKDNASLMALLGACRNQGNVEMGERIAQQYLNSDPDDASGYVVLSNIYAAAGHWDSCNRNHEIRKERGVKKLPGCTWIDVGSQMHSFTVDD